MSRDTPQRVRRCRHLLVEPQRWEGVDAAAALEGRLETVSGSHWWAWAPHRGQGVPIPIALVALLGELPIEQWTGYSDLAARVGRESLEDLLATGLLLGDHPAHAHWRATDEQLRAAYWWTPAAVAHWGGRWHAVDATRPAPWPPDRADAAPPAVSARPGILPAVRLEGMAGSALDALLQQRRTCRNFDPQATLPLAVLAQILRRTFGAHGQAELAPGMVALKKGSPSGGGLHPVEAFVLARAVDGLHPGSYHYHCIEHALMPIGLESAGDVAARALDFVAGQTWFADAAVLVVLVARFERSQWKYRNHPKAYRVAALDAGHLGQTLALAATELGQGSFITAAINECAIDAYLGLDAGREGALAVCGVGVPAATARVAELTAEGLLGA